MYHYNHFKHKASCRKELPNYQRWIPLANMFAIFRQLSVVWWTYCPAESLKITGHHLDLTPIFIGLLFGLTQGFSVSIGCICQVSKLCRKENSPTACKYACISQCPQKDTSSYIQWNLDVYYFPVLNTSWKAYFWPWIGTTPLSPACLKRPWFHTGPWCLSEQQSGLVWIHPGQHALGGPWSGHVTHAAPKRRRGGGSEENIQKIDIQWGGQMCWKMQGSDS